MNTDVSGFSAEYVAALRQSPFWEVRRPLTAPLADELAAINGHVPDWDRCRASELPVTLLLGELNRGGEPYGAAFDRIAATLPRARVELLPGQGHLAHSGAPEMLAARIAAAVTAAVP